MTFLDNAQGWLLANKATILSSVILVAVINLGKRLFVVRYLMKFTNIAILLFLLYRSFNVSTYRLSILDILNTIPQSVSHATSSSSAGLFVGDLLGILLLITVYNFLSKINTMSFADMKRVAFEEAFKFARMLPPVQAILDKEKKKAETDFEKDLKSKSRAIGAMNKILPKKGMPASEIISFMGEHVKKENLSWKKGRASGSVYFDWDDGENSHHHLLNTAFGYYSIANPLHPDMWPSGMKYEAEIISMTASLVSGGVDTVCGCTTSGGTESIILAIKAHRDYYCQKYGIKHPEMIAATSAHAAVDKGCDMLGVRLIKVPMVPGKYTIDVAAVKKSLSPNTILIYSSAPSYPQGTIDPISKLGDIAYNHDVGLHVDCCLGGFFLPFAKRLGYSIPDFEFSIRGVTSMSLDTHKYGYALKGASVILYRNKELRQAQYFCYADWPGGLYTTPTIAGSRSGGLISQCWASLMSLGEEGYLKLTDGIVKSTQLYRKGIESIDGLEVIGETQAMIVCFVGVNGVNVYSVVDAMSKKGWGLNSHQNPTCAHICVTASHVGNEEALLSDLRKSVEEVKNDPSKKSGTAAIYGMTSSLPAGPVNDMLKIYNDVVLKV